MISETFNNTVGTIVAFESSAVPKATVSGLTGVGGNDWMRSNTNSMDNSDNAFDIEFVVKWGQMIQVGVSDGRNWGTWGGVWTLYLNQDGKIYITQTGVSNNTGATHGLSLGDTATLRMKYESGTITAYVNGVQKHTYSADLSSYTTMYPLLYTGTEDSDYIISYTEVVPGGGGISASKRSINC